MKYYIILKITFNEIIIYFQNTVPELLFISFYFLLYYFIHLINLNLIFNNIRIYYYN